MSFIVIIPARFASQRLPGKPLLEIAGKTMIERVCACAAASRAKKVIVATDDQRIFDRVRAFGGEVLMTSAEHPSGTDRLQEVAARLALDDGEIVVNVQGDEPLMPAAVINQVADNLAANADASAATLSEPVTDIDTVFNPNTVKVVTDKRAYALYFSRAAIPWHRGGFDAAEPALPAGGAWQRHIGIYAYRVELLHQFVRWPASPLETSEKLEQLRILSNGHKLHVAPCCEPVPGGVDTPQDLATIQRLLARGGCV